jgi:hypothetical protein
MIIEDIEENDSIVGKKNRFQALEVSNIDNINISRKSPNGF